MKCLTHFEGRPFLEPQTLAPGVSARFIPAGHILGAAQIALTIDDRRLHFTGDLGRASDALRFEPATGSGIAGLCDIDAFVELVKTDNALQLLTMVFT